LLYFTLSKIKTKIKNQNKNQKKNQNKNQNKNQKNLIFKFNYNINGPS